MCTLALCSGKIKSVSDRLRDKLHGVHQRLLRHGETTAKLHIHCFMKWPFYLVNEILDAFCFFFFF